MKEEIDCPICNGQGKIPAPKLYGKGMDKKVAHAKKLKKAGLSYREIMRAMGYKSTRAVVNLLNK